MVTQEQVIDMIKCLPNSMLQQVADSIKTILDEHDIDYEFIPNEETLEAFEEICKKKENGTLKRYIGTAEEVFAMIDEEDIDEE